MNRRQFFAALPFAGLLPFAKVKETDEFGQVPAVNVLLRDEAGKFQGRFVAYAKPYIGCRVTFYDGTCWRGYTDPCPPENIHHRDKLNLPKP